MAIHQFNQTYSNGSYTESWNDFAEGTTLYVGTRSTQIMSDVWGSEYYALYWDEESQSVKHAHLDTYEWDRSTGGYGLATATVDATEEVWEKVKKYYEEQEYKSLEQEALSAARKIVKDSLVKVTAGRNNKGAEGKVVAIIERSYGMGYRSSIENKLGIATSEEKIQKKVGNRVYDNYKDVVWVWARNCELTQVPAIDVKAVRDSAKYHANAKVQALKGGRA